MSSTPQHPTHSSIPSSMMMHGEMQSEHPQELTRLSIRDPSPVANCSSDSCWKVPCVSRKPLRAAPLLCAKDQ